MLGSLVFAAALTTGAAPLDAASLKAAMQEARAAESAAPVGRTFKIEIPFVDGAKRNVPTMQSPARWVYDYRQSQLDLIIGPGEITAINYDQFGPQGLDKLPQLQSFVFDSHEITNDTDFTVPEQRRSKDRPSSSIATSEGYTVEFGKRSMLSSFAIAAPYDEKDVSGLPEGFKPLNIHKVNRLPQRELHSYVSRLTLVLEGETTDLGQKPPMFCGGFRGGIQSKALTGDKLISIQAKQCFVTARITKVTVRRGDEVLATWPRAAGHAGD